MGFPQAFNENPRVSDVVPTHVAGVATNSDAAPGDVGEVITSTVAAGAPVALSTGTTANVTSVALTAGDWDVSGFVNFVLTGVTGSPFQSGPSLVSATLPTQPGGGGLGTDPLALSGIPVAGLSSTNQQQSGPVRVKLAAPATVYLAANAAFSLGTVNAHGTLRARRAR